MKYSLTSVLTCIVLLFPYLGIAQEADTVDFSNMSKKEIRAYKKEVQKKQDEENMKKVVDLLESKEWVVETNTLRDRYGQSYQTSPTINFIGIAGETATVQLGTESLVGYNGVGGITADGKITKYELNEGGKNQGPTVKLSVFGGSIGQVNLTVRATSNFMATIDYNSVEGDRLSFSGRLVSLEETTVYKGWVTY